MIKKNILLAHKLHDTQISGYNYFQRGASGERCPAQAPRGQTHPAPPCPSGPGSTCLHPWGLRPQLGWRGQPHWALRPDTETPRWVLKVSWPWQGAAASRLHRGGAGRGGGDTFVAPAALCSSLPTSHHASPHPGSEIPRLLWAEGQPALEPHSVGEEKVPIPCPQSRALGEGRGGDGAENAVVS